MTRTMDFEEIKRRLDEDVLDLKETTMLAEELIAHVDYWQKAEHTTRNFLTKKLQEATASAHPKKQDES